MHESWLLFADVPFERYQEISDLIGEDIYETLKRA